MGSLLRNTSANYLGQGVATVAALLALPFYLRYLGAEAYGLVGFFSLLQAWFVLLDVGLSPTLGRLIARARGCNAVDWGEIRALVRKIEKFFACFTLSGVFFILCASSWIASDWLKISELRLADAAYCVRLMGGVLGLRAMVSLYRGGLQGLEDMLWLNVASALISIIRFGGAVVLLAWVSPSILIFFEFQLIVALAEAIFVAVRFYSKLPKPAIEKLDKKLPEGSNGVGTFTLSLAYTTLLWLLLSQTDKLVLSKVLPLEEYGYFSLVSTVASGIYGLITPVTQAVLPRITYLFAAGREDLALQIYEKSTGFVCVFIFALSGFLSVYADAVILAWTHSQIAAEWARKILPWLLIGNSFLCLSTFPYLLQNAKGQLSLHVKISTVSTFLQLPVVLFAASYYGAMGAAISWCACRLVSFFATSFLVHRKYISAHQWSWYRRGIFPFFLISLAGVVCMSVLKASAYESPIGGILVLLAVVMSSVFILRKGLGHI